MNDQQCELLNAFNDGQLDEAGAAKARKLLEEDAAARAYLERIAVLDSRLRETFDPIAREPLPPQLWTLFRHRQRRRFVQQFVPLAVAASLLLAALVVLRPDSTGDEQLRQQLMQMQQDIAQLRYRALENIPSGKVASWTATAGLTRAEVVPLKTFRTANDRFCREYEERIEDANGVEIRRGIACRAEKGYWPDLATDSAATGNGGFDGRAGGLKM